MPADPADCHAALEQPTETTICVGRGSALVVSGWCFHAARALVRLTVLLGQDRLPVDHMGLVRPDV